MNNIIFKGGYGEHGRSCFIVKEKDLHFMLDCGIMDTDPFPYPSISENEAKSLDYLFITHCHKDHMGAFDYLIKKGFQGKLICSRATYELSSFNYKNCHTLERNGEVNLQTIKFTYGSSGHCPGSLWFAIQGTEHSYFFSGDFQQDTLAYHVDKPVGIQADVAVVDLAHKNSLLSANERRNEFQRICSEILQEGKKVILPTQKYGRGVEMLIQVLDEFSAYKIKVDDDFVKNLNICMKYTEFFKPEAYRKLSDFLNQKVNDDWNILFIGEPHLEKETNQCFLNLILDKSILLSTGRIKKGGYIDMLNECSKLSCTYTHHQSIPDMKVLLDANDFDVVYPFHNNDVEIIEKRRCRG